MVGRLPNNLNSEMSAMTRASLSRGLMSEWMVSRESPYIHQPRDQMMKGRPLVPQHEDGEVSGEPWAEVKPARCSFAQSLRWE